MQNFVHLICWNNFFDSSGLASSHLGYIMSPMSKGCKVLWPLQQFKWPRVYYFNNKFFAKKSIIICLKCIFFLGQVSVHFHKHAKKGTVACGIIFFRDQNKTKNKMNVVKNECEASSVCFLRKNKEENTWCRVCGE